MIRKIWLIGTAAALGLMAASAEAAPATGAATGYQPIAGESAAAQNVHWYRGYDCGYGCPSYYSYYARPYPRWRHYYGPPRYYYGYAPDFRFYWGPRHRHRHWRHWW